MLGEQSRACRRVPAHRKTSGGRYIREALTRQQSPHTSHSSLEVIQPDDDPVQSGPRPKIFPLRVRRLQPNLFIHVESHPHRAGSQVVPKRGSDESPRT